MGTNQSTAAFATMLAQRIAALQKYGGALGNIFINGQTFTAAQLEALYQACITDGALVGSARGALGALVAQQKKDVAAVRAVDNGVKVAVVAKYGATSEEVSNFGFTKQPKKATVKVKAQAVEQTANTRKLRHIMGKNQRQDIKPAVVVETTAAVTGSTPNKS